MNFQHLTSKEDVRELIYWHNKNSAYVVCDFETTSKDANEAQLVDIQLSGKGTDSAVLFAAEFLPLLLEIEVPIVGWNFIKYDVKVAYRHGVDLRDKPLVDAMLLDHLVDENREHNLDSHVQEKYGDDYKEQFWKKYDSYTAAPFAERLQYACKDIVYTARIYAEIQDSLKAQGIPDTLQSHVHRLAIALVCTEICGLAVDLNYTIEMGSQLKADIIKAEQDLRRLGGHHCEVVELAQWSKEIEKYKTDKKRLEVEKPEFNFASSDQVSRLLYDQLKLPPQFNRKTRSRTADDKALEKIEHLHPIIPGIRELRKYNKMYGSFVEGLLDKVIDGRIYPGFNVNGTVTGRISHHGPNMGQMPSKGEWVKIRGIFVPDPGCKIITCDYGQLEVCIAAHFSMDKNLLKIIHEGASKHDITAEALGIPRPLAKTLNFAMQYLCEPPKVAELIGGSKKDGEYVWAKYWETYAGERQVVDECAAKVKRGEPIVNPFGRKRRFPTQFANKWEYAAACRQAYSSLIQGTGGDMTSEAFYNVSEYLEMSGYGRGLFTIHDEILAEAVDTRTHLVQAIVAKKMLAVGERIKLRVPLTVDCSPGLERWQK